MSDPTNETENQADPLAERVRKIDAEFERLSKAAVNNRESEVVDALLTLAQFGLTMFAELVDAVQLIGAVMHEEHRVKQEKENPQSRRDARNFIGSRG